MIDPSSFKAAPSPQVAGIVMIVAAVVGLFAIMTADTDVATTSPGEIIALGVSAVAWLAIGWSLIALFGIHTEERNWMVKVGFWATEIGLMLLTIGYLGAIFWVLTGIDLNADTTPIAAMVSGILALAGFGLFVPTGLVILG